MGRIVDVDNNGKTAVITYTGKPLEQASSSKSELLTRCCKCGGNHTAIEWVEHREPHNTPFGRVTPDNEHIALTCRRCGYAWRDVPLDKRVAC